MIIFDFVDNSASPGGEDRSLHPGLNFGPWIFCFNRTASVAVGTFSVDFTTDILALPANGLANGNQVRFDSTGTLPGGLDTGFFYYVVNVTTDTLQVSQTLAGSPIDITDNGIGIHTLTKRGLPFDLTGWTAWAWVKNKTSDADTAPGLVLDLGPTIVAPSDGRVQIAVDDNASFALNEFPSALWDLIMSDPTGERYGKYAKGKFQILKAVTHPAFP